MVYFPESDGISQKKADCSHGWEHLVDKADYKPPFHWKRQEYTLG